MELADLWTLASRIWVAHFLNHINARLENAQILLMAVPGKANVLSILVRLQYS